MVTRGPIQQPIQADFVPLTERILAWLPGPHWLWIALWALLPFVRMMELVWVMGLAVPEPRPDYLVYRLPYELVFAFLVVLSFWAVGKWTCEVIALQPTLARLTRGDGLEVFRNMTSRSGPLILLVVLTVVSEIDFVAGQGVLGGLLVAPLAFLTGLPVIAGFWVYFSVLVGLNRLGSHPLLLEPFPEDRSLGLRPVGALAFSAFWVFVAGIVPLLLVTIEYPVDLAVSLVVFLLGVAIFFLSLMRLHRQMSAARQHHSEQARAILAQVLEPLRASPTTDTLRQQTPLLSAAEILIRHAEAIQRWPFDDSTLRVIVTIVSGVIAALVSRLILRSVGL
jgi:hypothetical protein